jgi:very-short-patch-repair endonuclease
MLLGSEETQRRARSLRKNMSLPEVLLWQRLKGNFQGLRFRRQRSAGDYVADFYCHRARLIIEIDGISHEMGNRPFTDEERDAWFRARKLEVIRIPATDVLRDPDAAAQSIVSYCAAKAAERTH